MKLLSKITSVIIAAITTNIRSEKPRMGEEFAKKLETLPLTGWRRRGLNSN
ncbi:hypothetical protein JIN84_09910 [Luteolibacter yonseiensis]|uniref:Uncharacterized protein n=1 Tax=Luteolibacter yonseiensis TaxID=1144680 RepID=A0A934VBZ0_9BACT|nr:hypothetical protein [Luteolibacter yonseiensis]MBK1815934.1 hypothetical protein [Luteolibacter yonseiensis]